jgi:hypothetical protein
VHRDRDCGAPPWFAIRLQTVNQLLQQIADHIVSDLMTHGAQSVSQIAKTPAGPQQGRLRITSGLGSTRSFRSANSGGSVSVAFFPPPPGRRTRPTLTPPVARSGSSRSCRSVLLANPVTRDTTETPPCPAMRASAATNRRRPHSSRTGSGAACRHAMGREPGPSGAAVSAAIYAACGLPTDRKRRTPPSGVLTNR